MNRGPTRVLVLVWSLVGAATTLLGPGKAVSASIHEFPSGISARIYGSDEIRRDWLVQGESTAVLRHPAAGGLELLTGPQDVRLRRAGVDSFWSFSTQQIVAALAQVHTIDPNLEVEIFLLPSPPVELQNSFAVQNRIFLSPGFGPIAASSQAYSVIHELGHVLTWAYLDPRPGRWLQYLQLRGIEEPPAGSSSAHSERSREVLAEDIRFLFGGALANVSGSIENHDLPLPDRIPGLRELLAGFLAGDPPARSNGATTRAFPNPCNPVTTIEMLCRRVGDGWGPGEWILSVYDLRGLRVRCLSGISAETERLSVIWDGRDQAGRPAPSGRYLYAVSWRGVTSRGSVLLVK